MSVSSEMQFYLSVKIDCCEKLIKFLSNLLGMRVETLEHPDSQAAVFLMITQYSTGFPLGIHLSWRQSMIPHKNYLEIAKRLAAHYNILVATDLPEGYLSEPNPYRWCVTEPDGTLVEMSENTSIDSDGLVFDEKSRKIIQESAIYSQTADDPLGRMVAEH